MKLVKDIGLVLLLIAFWLGATYYVIEALLPGWGIQCGVGSAVIGLFLIIIITRTEEGEEILFGEGTDEEGLSGIKIAVWLLLSAPVILFVVGTVWWTMRLLGFFG